MKVSRYLKTIQNLIKSFFDHVLVSYFVNLESCFKQTSFAIDAEGRFNRVFNESDLMPTHVILNVNAQKLALQPRKSSSN